MEFDQSFIKGNSIILEPVREDHLKGLMSAGQDPHLWDFVLFALDDETSASRFIRYVSALPEKGEGQAYAIRLNETGEIVGGSGYWHIDHQHRKLEIGGSWVKYLMLTNAFENLFCNRVGFSVDTLNKKSLKAIERIGAVKEGIARSDMRMRDGRLRDSVLYSIVKSEWLTKKSHIEGLLSKYE